ncbi:Ig-like domain-containing protein [Pseudoalteromonas denitrificans]|uniref:GlyGly-CTERM domain-containing protein n=1 Tax=Pseudoalteromonas denitrificans DSM 6059 TaxID=1123010 RepID=A0A1I1RCG8_9GAMM|nr:Ig-like domain-containing protein [Pseudoalteromonas denitrificans]SFD31942.1 GlyGly-CTERM domain-containing protein [Pseudoalteromonas denitrificans DSM 6059]
MSYVKTGIDEACLSIPIKSKLNCAMTLIFIGMSTFGTAATYANDIKIDDTVRTKVMSGAKNIAVSNPSHFNQNLGQMSSPDNWQPGDAVKVANPRHIRDIQGLLPSVNEVAIGQDPLLSKQFNQAEKRSSTSAVNVGINIDGLGFTGVNPPDTTGDIGIKYFIQSINGSEGSIFAIYDKTNGEKVAGPLKMADLATGDCTSTMGDPIILFDEKAKRWMITEFTNESTKKMCVYISKSEDPVAGGWYGYDFAAPEFPDYPKFSRMGGVYYISANEGGGAIYAIEREQMLKGKPARMQRQTVPSLAGFGFQSITPVDVDGESDPVAGTPGYFIRHRDDELHNSGANDANKDFLELWKYSVDFNNADNSKVEGPINIPVTDFDSNFTCDGFGCLAQKGSETPVDPLKEVVMYKAQYRKFSGHESIVGNYVTKTKGNVATLRWFELRKIGDGQYSLHDEGAYNVDDGSSRYMAASAMDSSGNLAIAYMVTGPDRYPSLAFTGRLASDTAGTMSFGENVIVEGTGPLSTVRDGDYAQMGVDPVDNCTFWFTGEYSGKDGQWGTRITSFKVPSCGDPNPGFTLSSSNTSQKICKAGNLEPINISISGYNEFNKAVNLSLADLPTQLSGNFSANPILPGKTAALNMLVAQNTSAGSYSFNINASSEGVKPKSSSASIEVVTDKPAVSLTVPNNEATDVKLLPTFEWSKDALAQSYIIDIATDAEFSSIVATATINGGDKYRPSQKLAEKTKYFWRVKASNICGETIAEVKSFTTGEDIGSGTQADPYFLKENEPYSGINVAANEMVYFVANFEQAPTSLTLKLTADNGDGDLYAGFSEVPQSRDDLVCSSENPDTSIEECIIENPQAGKYFVMVSGYAELSNATLLAITPPPVPAQITGQTPVVINEDTFTMLSPENLAITDPDSAAKDFILKVGAGENYQLFDNVLQPKANFYGELTVPVKIFDGKVDSESFNLKITVKPVNDTPKANSDIAAVKQDSKSNMISVIENDTDVDMEDVLTIKSVDYNGGGVVEIKENKISYVPKAGFSGIEKFNYTISDKAGAESQSSVTIVVEAKPVVAPAAETQSKKSSGSLAFIIMLMLPLMWGRRSKP